MKARIVAGVTAGTLAAASVFIVGWEGNKKKPYLDVGGVPTACAGVTKGIDFARLYSDDECKAMNAEQIAIHAQEVMACVKRDVTPDEQIALISFAYNVGSSQACGSTLMAKLNRGEYWCDELLRWNKVQGTEVRGLTNRRAAERQLCIKGRSGA